MYQNTNNAHRRPGLHICSCIFALIYFFLVIPNIVLADPIHDASKAGDVDKVQALLAKGAQLEAKDKNGNTPLMIGFGKVSVLKALIKAGANVNAQNNYGDAALHMVLKLIPYVTGLTKFSPPTGM